MFLVYIIGFETQCYAAIHIEDFCKKLSLNVSNCHCSSVKSPTYMIKCDHTYEITIAHDHLLKITCLKPSWTDTIGSNFEQLFSQNIKVNGLYQVTVDYCPLKGVNEWMMKLLEIFDVTEIENLKITLDNVLEQNDEIELYDFIKKNKNLKYVTLSNFRISQYLLSVIENVHHLRNLTIILESTSESETTNLTINAQHLEHFELISSVKWKPLNFDLDIPSLITLKLESIFIDNLWEGLLHLVNLRELNIYNCGITEINAIVFANMPKLENFISITNNFTFIAPKAFQNNSNIKNLKLMDIYYLDYYSFVNLENLNKLEMTEIYIDVMPDILCLGCKKLEYLKFSNIDLETMPRNFLKSLSNLKTIDFTGTNLKTIPDKFFNENEYLETILLVGCEIQDITTETFNNLFNLETLDLKNNKILKIGQTDFRNLYKLKTLNLSSNNITDLYIDNSFPFKQLNLLEHLDLSNNSIKEIPPMLHENLKKIKSINLSFNNITTLDMLRIVSIGLVSDKLDINLKNNKIDNLILPKDFYRPTNLALNLQNNRLKCDCKLLQIFNLIDNKFIYINGLDDTVCTFPETNTDQKITDLSKSELTCACDLNVLELEDIDFKSQKYPEKHCDCKIRPFTSTILLRCSNITKLPNFYFPNNWGIQLNVSNNSIQNLSVPNTESYSKVTVIDAKFNNISIIELPQYNKTMRLKDLRLDSNQLSIIPDHIVAIMSHFDNVSLNDNPIQCDCSNDKLMSLVREQTIVNRDHLICSNTKITFPLVENICKAPQPLFSMISGICIILLIIISINLIIFHKFKLEIRILIHHYKIRINSQYRRRQLNKIYKYDAFISFSEYDTIFVNENILKKLESPPYNYKLCSTHRDFDMTLDKFAQISKFVDESARTIVVVSPNFLKSCWNRVELRTAYFAAFEEGRAPVIVIIHGEYKKTDNLEPGLKVYIKTKLYIKSSSVLFWKRLIYALPKQTVDEASIQRENEQNILMNDLNED